MERILLILPQWIDKILHGGKRVELRSTRTHIRGKIGLGHQGTLYGCADLVDCFEVDDDWLAANERLHLVTDPALLTKYRWAWLLRNIHSMEPKKQFHQPRGCQQWVLTDRSNESTCTSSSKRSRPSSKITTSKLSADTASSEKKVTVVRLLPSVLDKIFQGQTLSFLVDLHASPLADNNVTEVYLGSSRSDLVVGVVKLNPRVQDGRKLSMKWAFNMSAPSQPSCLRPFSKVVAFPRTMGSGKPFPDKGPHTLVEECLLSDLRRNALDDTFASSIELPAQNLKEVAHSFIQALNPHYLDRLRTVTHALDGSCVNLATTCSGVESVPAIGRAVFRPDDKGVVSSFSMYVHM